MHRREDALLAIDFAKGQSVPTRVQAILDVRHPELASAARVIDQPHAAREALALFDHRLRQRAEKSFDVRLAHEQIERELHDFGLHVREALRAAVLAGFANQPRTQNLGIGGGGLRGQARVKCLTRHFALGWRFVA